MKKLIYIIGAALLTAAASSCSDLLKPESKSSFTDEAVFSNYNLAEGAIFGIADMLTKDKSYRNRFLTWYGFNTDIEWYNSFNHGDMKSNIGTYELNPASHTNTLNEADGCFSKIYLAVERANVAIQGLRKYGNTGSNANMAYLLGEALTLRAMLYYDLVKAWGDVPARFEPTTSNTVYAKKANRDVIFKQILSDLEEAIDYLPYPGQDSRTLRTDRVNKVFAEGLYARIALAASGYAMRPDDGMEGTGDLGSIRLSNDEDLSKAVLYPKALAHLKDAIDRGGCSLDGSFAAYWKRQSAKQNLSWDGETLFVIPNGDGRGRWNTDFAVRCEPGTRYNPDPSNSRGGSVGPVPNFYWKYEAEDTRRDVTCVNYKWDKDNTLAPAGIATWYFGKYRLDYTNGYDGGTDDGVKPVVMRYADVLLMAAEIENELNGPTDDAKNWLLEVRSRAYDGNEDMAEAYVNALSSKEDFFNAIIDERALEFCGEFLRKADLIRWNLLKTKIDAVKPELEAIRDRSGAFSFLPEDIYYKFDEAAETITIWGLNPGETTKPAGSWLKKSNYFGKVADESGKPTGLYQARIDGIYTSGEKMEWYMYWPIWSAQTSASMGTLVNDYYYD